MNALRLLMCGLIFMVLTGVPSLATAKAGPYLGLWYGVSQYTKSNAYDNFGTFKLEADAGGVAAAALGYELPPRRMPSDGRVELELAQRNNSASTAIFSDAEQSVTGDLVATSLMFNGSAVYRSRSRFAPYIGLGLGGVMLTADKLVVGGSTLVDDETFAFAWQATLGLEYQLSRRLRLDLNGRFFSAVNPEFTEPDGSTLQLDYASYNGMLGLVWEFN